MFKNINLIPWKRSISRPVSIRIFFYIFERAIFSRLLSLEFRNTLYIINKTYTATITGYLIYSKFYLNIIQTILTQSIFCRFVHIQKFFIILKNLEATLSNFFIGFPIANEIPSRLITNTRPSVQRIRFSTLDVSY